MDAYSWWYSRLRTYNISLFIAGIGAFLALAIVAETFSEQLPNFEITIFTLTFQAAGYLTMMAFANLGIVLIGPAIEKRIEPERVESFRKSGFRVVVWVSCATPYLIPLILLVKAMRAPSIPEGY